MKIIFSALALLAMSTFFSQAFAQKLVFSYDASGNQTERRWVCINCRPAQGLSLNKDSGKISTIDGTETAEVTSKSLKIFPNPISENVNISWQLPKNNYVKTMDIFSMGGNRVFSGKYGADQRNTQIGLNQLPPGTYLLVIKYSDATTESVKLIKI